MTTNEFKIKHQNCTLRVTKLNRVDVDNGQVELRCDYHGEEVIDHVPYGRFCHMKKECVGRASCPREFACDD